MARVEDNKKLIPKEIPLNKKLVTALDPALVGDNFQSLKNMRPTPGHIKAIDGMTKINATALSGYLKCRNGFHFEKKQPAENHVLVQAYNTGLTASQVLQNETAIPNQGDFSGTALHTDASGAGRGRFSSAPRGCVGYCNGEESMIWSGDEGEASSFITATAAITNTITNPMEHTEQVRNNINSIKESATIGGGNDANAKVLLHFNGVGGGTTFTDDGVTGHTFTAVDDAQLRLTHKFPSASCYFDGSSDCITAPDHADWTPSGNTCIDFWWKHNNAAGGGWVDGLFMHRQDDNNAYQLVYTDNVGGTANELSFEVKSAGNTIIDVTVNPYNGLDEPNIWYHIAVERVVNTWSLYVDGVAVAVEVNGASVPNFDDTAADGKFYIGRSLLATTNGYIDEFRLSNAARYNGNFTPSTRAYRSAGTYWLVGNDKPLQGVKYYVKNANIISGTMTCKEWNGAAWDTLTITDNTATGGVPLAKTGTVTWSSTEDTSKMKYLQGMLLYWYQFYIGAATANADIYYTTVDAPFQKLRDLWDGIDRELISFQWWDNSGNVYNDLTLNVFGNEYISTNSGTYADLNALAATVDALYVGFAERTTAISLNIVSGKQNTTAATTATVYYWNGSAWTSVGTIVDGTSENSISLAQTGVISWSAPNREEEFRTEIGNSPSLYYYKIVFNQTFPANLPWLYYISGIPAQKEIQGYNFPFMSHDRNWLCGQKAARKNSALCSTTGSTVCFNGEDSMEFEFGDDADLTAAANLFSQFGSSLYNINIFCKANESWVLSGNGPEDWVKYRLSENVGCPAPLTMDVVDLPIEVAQGGNRSLAIWQGANGIYMSDGRAPVPIHGSIENYFDKSKSECIRASKIGDSDGWIDHEKLEYHWLFASGASATTLNKEWVFSIREQKWFEIDRGTGKRLQCAFGVKDTDGNTYTYGCIDTGYMERLENGNDFDGGDIDCEFQFGDMALHEGKISYETRLRNIRLIATAQNSNGGSVTCTHYGDSKATGTAMTMVQTNSGYRLVNTPKSDSLGPHVFHSLKFQLTRASGDVRFEPLFVIAMYKISRIDTT